MFNQGVYSRAWVLNGELRSAIMNFDFDAFLTAAIKSHYEHIRGLFLVGGVIQAISTWIEIFDRTVRHAFQFIYFSLTS